MHTYPIFILLPLLLIWVIVTAAYVLAARRDGRAPADDIGVLWLVVFALYTTLPPVSWLLQGGSYGLLSARLLGLDPSATEVAQLLNLALAYTCGFAAVYFFLYRRVPRALPNAHISSAKMAGALAIILVFQVAMLVVGASGLMRTPESYIDSYRVVQELPLVVRQVLKVGGGIASVAMLVLLVAILQRWPRQRLLLILYIGVVLLSFDPEGSRAAVATGLLSIAIAWHILVRAIPARWWFFGSFFGLVIFLILGLKRNLGRWDELVSFGPDGLEVGEFESLWANAVELLHTRDSGLLNVPAAARFGEFWAFIPSQLLPFHKLSLSEWFVQTFYPAYYEAGGGLAFGAITQAVIGDGILEAVFRGFILGAIAVWLMKWYRTPSAAWWRLPLYLYLLVFVYQSVRDTTFRQFGDVVQIALPALFLIALAGKLFASIRNTTRPTRVA